MDFKKNTHLMSFVNNDSSETWRSLVIKYKTPIKMTIMEKEIK